MPYSDIDIPPGINRESTARSTGPRWYSGNNIRFRDTYAQTIGGWEEDGVYVLQGIGRGLHSWTDFPGNLYQCAGTSFKYYLITGTTKTDITPIRRPFTSAGNAITTEAAGSANVSIEDTGHGASINDFVVFTAVAATVDGITPAEFLASQEGYQIYEITDDNNYKVGITGASASAGGVLGGGVITVSYKIISGANAALTGQGFGAGPWGGDDFIPQVFGPLAAPFVTVTGGGSPDIKLFTVATFAFAGPTASVEYWVYPYGLSGIVSGFDTDFLNEKWWRVKSLSGGNAVIDVGFNIAAAGASGSTAGSFYAYDATDGAVEGATRGWGDASGMGVSVASLRTISIDNFGEDLMFANRGGPIFYYDTSLNSSSGTPSDTLPGRVLSDFIGSTDTPSVVDSFLISQGHGHTIAFGANDINAATQNRMLIRWSDRHNPFKWTPSASSEAGGEVLRSGSSIMAGVKTKDEIVVFTDSALYSMRYVGYPEVYGVTLITDGISCPSRMGAVAVDNSVYFIGNEHFYMYNGTVNPLPKGISNYVFDTINKDQIEKVVCGVNSAFTEVIWLYPEGTSHEPNRFVAFNYDNQIWSTGEYDMSSLGFSTPSADPINGKTTLNRTAWQDTSVFANPISMHVWDFDSNTTPVTELSSLMLHELGTSANGLPINHSIKSGEISLSGNDGGDYSFYDKVIPDLELTDIDGAAEGSLTVSVQGRDLPGLAEKTPSSITVAFPAGSGVAPYTPNFNATTIRGRARDISIEMSSASSGFGWRLGRFRVRSKPDGED